MHVPCIYDFLGVGLLYRSHGCECCLGVVLLLSSRKRNNVLQPACRATEKTTYHFDQGA